MSQFSFRVGAIAISDGSSFSDTSRPVFLAGPDCVGNESSILDCSQNFSCSSQGGVGVICQGKCLCDLVIKVYACSEVILS